MKRLVTSALPYVNNIPHLGTIIQVLSADVFARFCRMRGYETLYICGTDEYGTATETKAREEGISPRELCDRYYTIHDEVYRWFGVQFDRFGRTSTDWQTKITQEILLKLNENGYITEHTTEQLYSEASDMFLADRYVVGTCPHCGYAEARGDQCEECGKLLDPSDLIDPKSALDGSTPVMRETRHLYIDLPSIRPRLQEWMKEASVRGRWARNALQMTNAWIRDGLKERSITRDLKWGIPVPIKGYEDKVIYVWFDAPIGYISITANHTDSWEDWWKNPEEVELFQFIGKDNIPFHTVVFPCSLLGSGQKWTMLHHMSSTEYLNYEGGKFSKSKGTGVFGNDAAETGIPADVWRFYICHTRPETSDYDFTWSDFQERVNGELIGNLSNLVNRTLTFVNRYYHGRLAQVQESDAPEFWAEIRKTEESITGQLEWANLRDAFKAVFTLSSLGNKRFQEKEPWKTRREDEEGTLKELTHLVYLIRDLAILIAPYLPDTSARICSFLRVKNLMWADLADLTGIESVGAPEILFRQLTDEEVDRYRRRFAGSQAERNGGTGKPEEGAVETPEPVETRFSRTVRLIAARILSVQPHPEADRLFIEEIDDGSGTSRTIVSGLVGHYEPDQLAGKTVVIVDNLKTAKLRGVKSEGMLLAASDTDEEGNERIEVLFVDQAPGTKVGLEGVPEPDEPAGRIDIDTFFSVPIRAENNRVKVGKAFLTAGDVPVTTSLVGDGSVG
jgi:methionyl-tRNA synthetase